MFIFSTTHLSELSPYYRVLEDANSKRCVDCNFSRNFEKKNIIAPLGRDIYKIKNYIKKIFTKNMKFSRKSLLPFQIKTSKKEKLTSSNVESRLGNFFFFGKTIEKRLPC